MTQDHYRFFEKCEICGKYKDIDRMIIVANKGRAVRHYCYECYSNTTKKERKA